jgi:hypothetical protein
VIEFDFKGITIGSTAIIQQQNYKDAGNRPKTRFDRDVVVGVEFWDFIIDNGNLYELAFVKSVLGYFSHAYWKRSTKDGGRIDLGKVLHHENPLEGKRELHFVARQKNKRNYLHIYLMQNGALIDESYFDGQEVLLLDIAIGKAISLLTPSTVGY